MIKHSVTFKGPFVLESGATLDSIDITCHISTRADLSGKPVVWICHALTANSDPVEWWPGMVGPGRFYDPEKYTIVCANILGSCYGTTGPGSIRPGSEKPWMKEFPLVTIRDMVKCHIMLKEHLGIKRIHTLTGASVGGFQALEWAVSEPDVTDNLILLASGSKATPWAIAINETKRMAMEADSSFDGVTPDGGRAGLAAARAIGLLSYRGYEAYNFTQSEENNEKTDGFRASSYQRYQGEKLVRRFNPYSYYSLIKAHDTHNIARGRGSMAAALAEVKARTLAFGISNDMLFPPEEQKEIARLIPKGSYHEIYSDYGHDGFLLENQKISSAIARFYSPAKPK